MCLSVIAKWSGHREASYYKERKYLFQIFVNITGNISATTDLCQLRNINQIYFTALGNVSTLHFHHHGLVYTFYLLFTKTHSRFNTAILILI